MHIFFHVPKAAGTTVREQIREQIGAQKVLNLRMAGALSFLSDDAINSMDLVAGHVGINLLNRIHVPYRAVAFLRDPVQRVFSQYRFTRMLAKRGDAFYRRSIFLEPLENVLRDRDTPVVESMYRNTQAWFFAADWEAGHRNPALDDADVLAIAKENIQDKLDCFGLVDEMDASFRLINRCFNWALLNDVNLNVAKEDNLQLTTELTTIIEEHNQLDIELHAWARNLFQERCRQWLGGEKEILRPNNFSGAGWHNGVRVDGGSKSFYFLAPRTSDPEVVAGDVVEFAASGRANVLRVEASPQNGVLSVFVTVDKAIDPVRDGFPNKVLVESKVARQP